MNILALDTATEACSCAVWRDGLVTARFEEAGRRHTALLAPMVAEVIGEAGLAFSELDGLVCGVGPGSFAGVRIGVGFAQGLALALQIPVAPVSSLAMLAQGVAGEAQKLLIRCALDARMDEVYVADFRFDDDSLHAVAPPQVLPPSAVQLPDVPWLAVGRGFARYPALADGAQALFDARLPVAADALAAGAACIEAGRGLDAAALAPLYLRERVALTVAERAVQDRG